MTNELTIEQRVKAAYDRAVQDWNDSTDKSPAYFLQLFTHEGDGCFNNRTEFAMCYHHIESLVSEQKNWSDQERATVMKRYKEAMLPELRRTYEPYSTDAFFEEVKNYNELDEFKPLNMKDVAFQKGTFNIIGARPGSGKTTLAVSLALQAVDIWRDNASDKRVIFLTHEESPKQIYTRIFNHLLFANARQSGEIASIQCDKPRAQLFKAIKNTDKKAIKNTDKYSDLELKTRIGNVAAYIRKLEEDRALQVINFAGKGISAIESLLKFHECAAVFIDYVQLIRPDRGFATNELAGLNDISRRLADCAKDNNLIIIAAAQLRRAGGNKDAGDSDKPSMLTDSRLKDCGQLEQDANTIIELGKNTDWKECKREEHTEGEPLYFWKLVKNRDGGGVNSCYLFNTADGAMGFSYMASTKESADFLEREPKKQAATPPKKKVPDINDDKPPTAEDMLRSMQW